MWPNFRKKRELLVTWNSENIPNLQGKTAIVTGGNVGLGFESSRQLARKGAKVIIGCRRIESGKDAVTRIQKETPVADLSVIPLDLIDPQSISNFVKAFNSQNDQLHILLNNAGVVNLENRQTTKEGHEMHMATNHFGHFALTGLLFSRIIATPESRVVTVSSGGYRFGKILFEDLNWEKRPYHRIKSYGDSKLANVLFMLQLQKEFDKLRLGSEFCTAISVGSHPGLTGTERQQTIGVGGVLSKWLASPVSKGVLPQLKAATDPLVEGGQFYGPRFGVWGEPKVVQGLEQKVPMEIAERLWTVSEEATGVVFPTK